MHTRRDDIYLFQKKVERLQSREMVWHALIAVNYAIAVEAVWRLEAVVATTCVPRFKEAG